MEARPASEPTQSERRLHQIVEALIFAAADPLPPERIAEVVREVRGHAPEVGAVEETVERLNERYTAAQQGLQIERWAGGFRMTTAQAVTPYLKAFRTQRHQRSLSRSLMETLAVVAYRQPTTKPEVDYVRGVDAGYALRKLMALDLIDVVGRSDAIGRPLLYGTTEEFLVAFGLNTVDDLPDLRSIEELLDDPAFDEERAELMLLRELPVHQRPGDASPPSAHDPAPADETSQMDEKAGPDEAGPDEATGKAA
ncbi:MAG: SMC-Scp complex subunit ScpB [Bacteroidetes bacterium]|jgi:segregation and condensation protein B|nr:SMC-Scp complex subunit ScpB [Bacteroidota bacterium]